ncbi:ATP-binding cassette, subfamily B [Halalkaliarchaeum desulfuricum]|uniref:ATP-binding cassette, subfamily B n=1 Tax=Halalkaliarchaeum desulfuricum TaxID=2055893 RepID=A0A343TLW0_9EURY|nr:ABC transporter ATP-binding protein [Halalkaliarchaeum desulfuricum]AUX10082.1 ATP-binding cassette, subfamily B [Halalkaliarchaeum desulfuricum]
MSTNADADDRNVFEVYRDRVDRPITRLFREYGTAEWPYLAVGMTANVIARLASLVPPLVLGVAIDAVFTGEGEFSLPIVPDAWLPADQAGQFWLSVGLIVGGFLVTAVFTWIYGVAANYFAHRVMHAVRTDSFAKMQQLDMTFFDDKQTGEVMSVLNNDATNLERFLDNALQNSARLGVMVLGIAAVLFYLNWQLAIVTLIAIPLMVLFTVWFIRAIEPRYVKQRAAVGDLNTVLENALSGVELVKTSNTEAYETERVRRASFEYFRRTISILKLNYLYRPGMELLAGVAFAATFLVGGIWLFAGPPGPFTLPLSVGAFVTFVFLTQQFVAPLAEVSNIVDQYENAKASAERVFGLQDVPIRITDAPNAITLDVQGRVAYEGVSFAYVENALQDPADAGEYVLSDVSFEAEPGETVAFVGPTGAGKSTLLKLLLRLYEPTEGSIRVDGHDIRDVEVESLRNAIGYVSQDTTLFDGTIAENIRYGRYEGSIEVGADPEETEGGLRRRLVDAGGDSGGDVDAGGVKRRIDRDRVVPDPEAVRDQVTEAAKAAEAHEFIASLPEGYDTRVGERGVKLSGGQRQRIAIARTVLQDPEILILDEATSAVDTETEMLIQRSLNRLAADRTTFAIAHRLSTIKDADRILVLEGGAVVERGTHGELLARDGLYAKLWGVQAGEIESLPEEFIEAARERANERGIEPEFIDD